MAEAVLITTRMELDRLFLDSEQAAVLVFKHSLTCPISTTALKEYESFVEDRPEDGLYTVIEIQNAREVSEELARKTGVSHESPQALLLRGGRAVWSASHWDISRDALQAAIAEHAA